MQLVPVRVGLETDISFTELLAKDWESVRLSSDHFEASLDEIAEAVGSANSGAGGVFPAFQAVLLCGKDMQMLRRQLEGYRFMTVHYLRCTRRHWLLKQSCYSWELVLGIENAEDGEVRCRLGGSGALFTAGTVQRMASHLQVRNMPGVIH